MNKKIILAYITVLLAALLTSSRLFSPFGVNTNLALALLVAWMFLLKSRPAYFFLGSAAALFLKTSSGFEWVSAAFLILPFVFAALKFINPFHPIPGAFISAFLGTGIFYAVVDYHFILSHPGLTSTEGVWNGIWSVVALWVLKRG